MATNETQTTHTTAAATAGEPAETPILTALQERANAVIALIDEITAGLPPAEKTPLAISRSHRGVPKQFMKSMITVVQQHAHVRAVTALDTVASNNRYQLLDAYEPLLMRAEKFVDDMKTLLDATRSQLAYDTLDAYSNVKRQANRPGIKKLAFQTLSKELGRKRRAKDPSAPAQPVKAAPSPGITPPIATQPSPTPKTEVSATK